MTSQLITVQINIYEIIFNDFEKLIDASGIPKRDEEEFLPMLL